MQQATPLEVLVVEDDPVTASSITTVLAGLGWQVDFAASGRVAIKLQQQRQYDVVLLDITLPDMHSIDVYKLLKAQWGEALPVLFMRASTEQDIHLTLTAHDALLPDVADTKQLVALCQSLAACAAASTAQSLTG